MYSLKLAWKIELLGGFKELREVTPTFTFHFQVLTDFV